MSKKEPTVAGSTPVESTALQKGDVASILADALQRQVPVSDAHLKLKDDALKLYFSKKGSDADMTERIPHKTGASSTPAPTPFDKLDRLFHMQKALNARIGVHTNAMTEEEQTKWLLNYSRAMSQEMAELIDSVPWKWWAKYQKFDTQNAKVEVVDLFHFLISMAQVLGMSADDVFNSYVKKNEVNFKRQESGYTEKNNKDCKHI